MNRRPQIRHYRGLTVLTLPVLRDNYIFLLHDGSSGQTAAVDPALAEPVLEALEQHGWTLSHILNTHHHNDHVGGNLELKQATGCQIVGYGPDAARIPGIDVHLQEGERCTFGSSVADILFLPGHTLGHIAYHFAEEKLLFCGDTLFLMGCGRLFEGTPEQMHHSLQQLAALPDDTAVYCTHEYTQANGRFALAIEPENTALKERMREVKSTRKQGLLTIPGTIGEEKRTNPFLRTHSEKIRTLLNMPNATEVAVFTEIRKRKDSF